MKKVFLLGAKKRKKTATSSYIISTDPTNVSKNACVAKLRSNMMGTRLIINPLQLLINNESLYISYII